MMNLKSAGSEGGPQRVRRRIIYHVAECFVSRITGRRRGFGKKAKIWRGWGAYEGEDGIGARKNGWEGEEIGGEKMYRGLKSGLGTELVYYNGLGNTQILLLERDNNETQTHKRPSLRTHICARINTVWHLRNSHIKSKS